MIVARRIGEFQFATCATPGFLQAHGAPKTLDELRQRPSVGMVSARTGRTLPFRFLDGTTESEVALSHKLVVNDTNACASSSTGQWRCSSDTTACVASDV